MTIGDEYACPSALDLLEYGTDSTGAASQEAIAAHIAYCDACSGVLRNLQTSGLLEDRRAWEQLAAPVPEEIHSASVSAIERFRRAIAEPQPLRARFGQIWSTTPAPDPVQGDIVTPWSLPRLVVVLGEESEGIVRGETSLIVAPISLELAYQSDRDLLVPEESSPLGYPFMIEVWNEVTLPRAQLSRCTGTLRQPFKRYLGLLYQAQLGTNVEIQPVIKYLGPAISSADDPRAVFQGQEVEACDYLRGHLPQLDSGSEERSTHEAARTVITLLREHIPSGFPKEGDDQSLTVGDVAARLQGNDAALRALLTDDREANRRLLGDGTPVPLPVTEAALVRLAAQLGITAGARYWEAFRRAAIALAMTRQRGEADLAAARRQNPRPRRPWTARDSSRSKEDQG